MASMIIFHVPGAISPLAVELRTKMKRDSIISKQPIGKVFLGIVNEMDRLTPRIAEELIKFPANGKSERKAITMGVPSGCGDRMLAARDKIALLGVDLGTTAGKAFVALVAAYYADES